MSEIAEPIPLYKKVFDALIAHEFLPITREGITTEILVYKTKDFVDYKMQFGCGKIKINMSTELSTEFRASGSRDAILNHSTVSSIERWKYKLQEFKEILDYMKTDKISYKEHISGIEINYNEISVKGGDDFGGVGFIVDFDEEESIAFLEMIIELMEELLGVVNNAMYNKGRKIKAAR